MRAKAISAVGLAAVCLTGCGATSYKVPSPSMEPTLKVGQVVNVDDGAFSARSPQLGEIIVFRASDQAASASGGSECGNPSQGQPGDQVCGVPGAGPSKVAFIKRIVGLPGDRLAMVGGRVIRNGRPLREPYAQSCTGAPVCSFPKPITVPAQTYFVLGDNRTASVDSRFFGPVPRAWIVGLAKP